MLIEATPVVFPTAEMVFKMPGCCYLAHALLLLACMMSHLELASSEDRPVSSLWRPVLPAFLQKQVEEHLGGLQRQVQGKQNDHHLDFRSSGGGSRSVVSLVNDYGLFSMQMGIGSPPKNISGIIDTGSELFLVQCGSQSQPVFNPAASQTYHKVLCNSSLCNGINSSSQACNSSADNSCSYAVSYGDSRNSTGDFSQDVMTMGTSNLSQFKDVTFGCARGRQEFLLDLSSLGIVGFDRGNLSLPSQLKDRLSNKFSYCFPAAIWQPKSTGFIFLGASGVSKNLEYTPLLDNPVFPRRSQLYYINLRSIAVDGRTLAISESAFKVDQATGDGGTIIDSGTTFTRLVDDAYTPLRDKFDNTSKDLRKKVGNVSGFDDCYNISAGSGLPRIPSVTLSFDNDVKLQLEFEHLFVPVSANGNEVTICLAIVSSERTGFGKLNIIGNFQQSNYLIEYDNEGFRVGFSRAGCSPSLATSRRQLLQLGLLKMLAVLTTLLLHQIRL